MKTSKKCPLCAKSMTRFYIRVYENGKQRYEGRAWECEFCNIHTEEINGEEFIYMSSKKLKSNKNKKDQKSLRVLI